MKKLIIIAGFFLTVLFVNAQTKDTIPPDTEPVVSVKQINEVLEEMKKTMTIEMMPVYNYLLQQLQSKINAGVIEWRKKAKKKN